MKSSFQTESDLAALLQRVFYYDNHEGVTVREAASLTGKHERQVYHYISGDRNPDLAFLLQLSRYMIEKHNDDRIASYFLPQGYTIVRAAESDRAKVSMVLQILEEAIAKTLRIILLDDARAAAAEIDTLIRKLGELLRRDNSDHADEGTRH